MKEGEFISQMRALKDFYRSHDAYVQRYVSWNDDNCYEKCIDVAYKMYMLARDTKNGFLPLGDEGIKKWKDLVFNLGLASVTAPEEMDTDFVNELNLHRSLQRDGIRTTRKTSSFPIEISNITDSGAILSDKIWTTMMNDAFILGGTERSHPFVLVLSPEPTKKSGNKLSEHLMWEQVKNKALPIRIGLSYEEKWRYKWLSFFASNPQIIYRTGSERNGPRVLARELLGLSFFGYKPIFAENQLSFVRRNSTPTSFTTYLHKLLKLHFFTNNNINSQELVVSAIFEFLSDNSGMF